MQNYRITQDYPAKLPSLVYTINPQKHKINTSQNNPTSKVKLIDKPTKGLNLMIDAIDQVKIDHVAIDIHDMSVIIDELLIFDSFWIEKNWKHHFRDESDTDR